MSTKRVSKTTPGTPLLLPPSSLCYIHCPVYNRPGLVLIMSASSDKYRANVNVKVVQ